MMSFLFLSFIGETSLPDAIDTSDVPPLNLSSGLLCWARQSQLEPNEPLNLVNAIEPADSARLLIGFGNRIPPRISWRMLMSRLSSSIATAVLCAAWLVPAPLARQARAPGRPLAIEDYYRVQTIGNASFSPNSKWVAYTVTTRLEEPDANSSRADAWLVPANASAAPRRVQHQGKDVSNPRLDWRRLAPVQRRRAALEDHPDNASTAPLPIAGAPATAGRGGRGGRGGGAAVRAACRVRTTGGTQRS